MAAIGHASKTIDVDCQHTLPISVAFVSGKTEIVSAERYFNNGQVGGRVWRCQIQGIEHVDEKARVLVDTIDGVQVDGAVVSTDGQWIVSIMGNRVVVRNTRTNERLDVGEHVSGVRAIDVSPNSTRFASGSVDRTVRVFSITSGQRVLGPLQHNNSIVGVKFSPNGERLVTAAHGDPVRVWDALTGDLLLQTTDNYYFSPTAVNYTQTPTCTPIGWSSNSQRIFVVAVVSGEITCHCFNSSLPNGMTSPTQLWCQSIPASNDTTPCSLATNGRFLACSAGGSLSFWDLFSYTQIGSTIEYQDSILSIALSFDSSYLACGRADKKIIVYALRDIIPLRLILDPTSRLPLMNISDRVFQSWMEQDFYTAEDILCKEIRPNDGNHDAFANRALVRAHRTYWDMATADAKQSLTIRPTMIGYVAKAVVLARQGKHELAFEAFDAALCNCGADDTRFLLLLRAILLFVSGKREYAIARVNDLITVADDSTKYNCLQVLANMYLMQGDSERTMQSFARARSLSFARQGFHLVTILLIFGRSFEELEIAVRYPMRGTVTVTQHTSP